jgi:acetamidase/formamidase
VADERRTAAPHAQVRVRADSAGRLTVSRSAVVPHCPDAVPPPRPQAAIESVPEWFANQAQLADSRRDNTAHDPHHVPSGTSIGHIFGGHPPIATVMPGDLLHVRTVDCYGGAIVDVHDVPSTVTQWPLVDPVTGPFHIMGARPGDTLAVHIVSLAPASSHGLSSTSAHLGQPPQAEGEGPAAPEQVWQYDVDASARTVTFHARTSDYTTDLPWEPSLGTLGVAPLVGTVGSTVPGAHGGALHTPVLRPGTTISLGVHQPGALLAVGDGHARRGDGASNGAAVEIGMDVVLVVDVIDGVSTPVPRMETDTHVLSVGIGAHMHQAYLDSLADLTALVRGITGLDPFDAGQLVSHTVQVSLGNITGPLFTMVAGIDKQHLGTGACYSRVHHRLRSTVSHP